MKKSKPITAPTMADLTGRSIDSLIDAAVNRGWQPPNDLVPALDRVVAHNLANPLNRVGARKVAAWLQERGVIVSRDAVHRWLTNRSNRPQASHQGASQ